MVFTQAHWEELTRQGYTIVSHAIYNPCLRSAQDAANHLNAIHPDRGWERSKNELWREIRHCDDAAFQVLVTAVLGLAIVWWLRRRFSRAVDANRAR